MTPIQIARQMDLAGCGEGDGDSDAFTIWPMAPKKIVLRAFSKKTKIPGYLLTKSSKAKEGQSNQLSTKGPS